MSDVTAFQVQGQTVAIAPTASSQNVALTTFGGTNVTAFRIFNNSGIVCYMATGETSSIAAVIPVPGTPASGLPIGIGDIEVIKNHRGGPSAGMYIAIIGAAGATGDIYITPGEGI